MVCNGIISQNMETIDVEFNANFVNDLQTGEVVETTTSECSFDSVDKRFSKCDASAIVLANHISEDYSNFDPNFCRNGGKYGFDSYIVTSVLSVDIEDVVVTTEDVNDVEIVNDDFYVVSCDLEGIIDDLEELEAFEDLL